MEILKYILGKMKLLFHWFIMLLAMTLKTNAFHVEGLEKEDTPCNRNKYKKILKQFFPLKKF